MALARLLMGDGRPDEIVELLEPVAFDQRRRGAARARPPGGRSTSPTSSPASRPSIAATPSRASTHLVDAVRVAGPELRDDLRAALLGVFAELGEHHPLATRFRRRLAQALY